MYAPEFPLIICVRIINKELYGILCQISLNMEYNHNSGSGKMLLPRFIVDNMNMSELAPL